MAIEPTKETKPTEDTKEPQAMPGDIITLPGDACFYVLMESGQQTRCKHYTDALILSRLIHLNFAVLHIIESKK